MLKKKLKLTAALLIIFFMVIVGMNIMNKDFFAMDLYKILSLAVIIFVSYYLTQKNLDYRKQREIISDIIKSILEASCKMNKDALNSENCMLFMEQLRTIENKINLLKKVSVNFDFILEINYIDREI